MSWTRIVAAGSVRHVRHASLVPPAAAMTSMLSTTQTLLSNSTNTATTTRTWAAAAGMATSTRSFSSSPLDEFRDAVTRQKRMVEPVGRSWSVKELRRKSFEDLHKLWYVLYKEKNMLLTEQQLSRRKGIIFPQPERQKKVRKSMGAIKQVLGERKREKLSGLALAQMNDSEKMDSEMGDEEEQDEEETESSEKR